MCPGSPQILIAAYDKYDKNGILIQKYGPHFLNTDHYYVIEYLQQFARDAVQHILINHIVK